MPPFFPVGGGDAPWKEHGVTSLRVRLAEDTDLAALVRLRDDAARWMLARA